MGFTNVDPLGNPVTVTNQMCNFGWEFVDHCHILGHEENDMMRPMAFGVAPEAPANLTATLIGGQGIRLNWQNVALNATSITIQRASNAAFTLNPVSFTVASTATTFTNNPASRHLLL